MTKRGKLWFCLITLCLALVIGVFGLATHFLRSGEKEEYLSSEYLSSERASSAEESSSQTVPLMETETDTVIPLTNTEADMTEHIDLTNAESAEKDSLESVVESDPEEESIDKGSIELETKKKKEASLAETESLLVEKTTDDKQPAETSSERESEKESSIPHESTNDPGEITTSYGDNELPDIPFPTG